MTNYEHLVETGKLAEFLSDAFNCNFRIFFDRYSDVPYDENKTIGEMLTEYLQAEYKEPKLYAEVMDIIKVLSKYGRIIQDYGSTATSSTIRYVSAEEIIDELRTYTEKEIINNAKTQEG